MGCCFPSPLQHQRRQQEMTNAYMAPLMGNIKMQMGSALQNHPAGGNGGGGGGQQARGGPLGLGQQQQQQQQQPAAGGALGTGDAALGMLGLGGLRQQMQELGRQAKHAKVVNRDVLWVGTHRKVMTAFGEGYQSYEYRPLYANSDEDVYIEAKIPVDTAFGKGYQNGPYVPLYNYSELDRDLYVETWYEVEMPNGMVGHRRTQEYALIPRKRPLPEDQLRPRPGGDGGDGGDDAPPSFDDGDAVEG